MKLRYFYIQAKSGEIQGPFTASTLDKMYNGQKMSGQTLISPDKINWKTLEEYLYPPAEEIIQFEPKQTEPEESSKNPEDTGNADKADMNKTDPLPKSDIKETPLSPIFTVCNSPAEIIGSTLQLLWNTPDKLKELGAVSQCNVFSKVLPVSLIFPLLLTMTAAFSVAHFYGGTLQKICIIAGIMFCNMLLTFLEILCFPNKNNTGAEFMKKVVILSGMLWNNLGAIICIGTLQFAMILLPGKTHIQEWSIFFSSIFTLFSICFFISNVSIGLRTGLCSFFACRPRTTVWFSAFILSQYCGITILVCLIAKKYLYI